MDPLGSCVVPFLSSLWSGPFRGKVDLVMLDIELGASPAEQGGSASPLKATPEAEACCESSMLTSTAAAAFAAQFRGLGFRVEVQCAWVPLPSRQP